IARAHRYHALDARLARAFEFLQQTDLAALEEGRYELDGANLYALVQHYTTKRPDQGRWEAHQRYADLQCVVTGTERMGYGPLDRFTGLGYDAEKDVEFLTGSGDYLQLKAGEFVVLWPGEVHMPQMAVDAPGPVKKIVVKIAVD
ncbi:MAG: YhcH/YjgK/YiaL family protein, partial [Acidobacteria bacterium]|nr:YhcH/YjgK/YiaL family protein [Acidobacteriota bacterium]